jgi:uncharacterized protein YjbI with pentapeptide repeats
MPDAPRVAPKPELAALPLPDCELDGAQFSGVEVSVARFTGCELSGVGGVTSLAGATVTEADLPGLARALATAIGLTVEATPPR